ncbi:MAG TPA: type I phosphomannose isomerase catalytic subunit [Caproicibacter sp.]|nr:type I phosphomannose isomerase catalytic subunit [Caproicibacter sp.]
MAPIYPMKLKAACKDYLWGGTRLRTEYHQQSDAEKVAESWMLSSHPDGPSSILNGEYEGLLFPEYLTRAGREILGTDCDKFPDFPVLIKLIDAKDRLSIQVHPDDAYARTHGGEFGKTEMWYIVDCEPGASLYYGFDHPISKEEFKQRIENNTLEEVLNKVQVHPGDVFFIESRTLHAIGAGILIAEIQQNSNLTYRIYDYGRIGKDGNPRQLHISEALDVTLLAPPTRPAHAQGVRETGAGYSRILLSSCDIFTVYEMEIREAALNADNRSFHSLVCIGGDAILVKNGKAELSFEKGDSVFIPAGYGDYTIKGDCLVLWTTV